MEREREVMWTMPSGISRIWHLSSIVLSGILYGCSACSGTAIEGEADADGMTEPDIDLVEDSALDPIIETIVDATEEELVDLDEGLDPTWDAASDCTMYDDVVLETSTWVLTIGDVEYEYPTHITVGPDGRIIISATRISPPDVSKFLHIKIDGTGHVIEQKVVENVVGYSPDVGGRFRQSVLPLGDCGILLAGNTAEGPLGGLDLWLAKLDWSGRLLWQKALGGEGNDYNPTVIETRDGGLLVAAMSKSWSPADADLWLVKLSPYADIIWQQSIGGNTDDYIRTTDCIMEAPDGTIYVATVPKLLFGSSDTWLLSLDSGGHILWQKTLGSGDVDNARWISDLLYDDGNLLLVGGDGSDASTVDAIWMAKMHPSGSFIWEKSYGTGMSAMAYNIIARGDGGYIAAGSLISPTGHDYDLWLASLDPDGIIDWQRYIGTDFADMHGMLVRHEDGLVIVGESATSRDGPSQTDLIVARIELDGTIPGSCPLITGGAVTGADVVTPLASTDSIPVATDGSVVDIDLPFIDADIPVTAVCSE